MNQAKGLFLTLALLSTLIFPTNIFAATVQEKIAGLYIAFFNRAPDNNGLRYWQKQAATLGEDNAVKMLASGFAKNIKFTSLYGKMSNQEFVKAIYLNTLGQVGDSKGIAYWTGLLDDGMSRSDMVANFVSDALDFDRNNSVYANLKGVVSSFNRAYSVLDIAQQRHDLLANKVALSLKFVELLGDETNLSPNTDVSDPNALDVDKAYKASVNLLHRVTYSKTTKDKVLHSLNLISSKPSFAIDTINRLKEQYGSVMQDDQTIKLIQSLMKNLKQYNSNFGTITSPVTGRVWMDRNLGASEVCTSPDDEACYGDYYQWGRYPDGHEKADSAITRKVASSYLPNSGKFVVSSYDWTTSDRSGTDRSAHYNVCPVGFRLPSIEELQEEKISNSNDAFNSLRLPTAGERTKEGYFEDKGDKGYLLSTSSVYANNYKLLNYNSSYASYALSSRAAGVPARCIKIIEPTRWVTSDWGSCQVACGTKKGYQSRSVTCQDGLGNILNDSYCTDPKPISQQTCVNKTITPCPNINMAPVAVTDGIGYNNIDINVTSKMSDIASNPTNGSAVKFIIEAEAGETISFDWQFSTDDYSPYNDFAFMSIDNEPLQLLSNISIVGNYGNSGLKSSNLVFSTSGAHVVTFGVLNTEDTAVASYLALSNFNANIIKNETLGNANVNNGVWSLVNNGANTPEINNFLSTNETVASLIYATDTGNVLNNDWDEDTIHSQLSVIRVNSTTIPSTGTDTVVNGQYGTLTINADGNFSYSVNSEDPTVYALNDGETLTDTFTYEISDNEGAQAKTDSAQLIITIEGVNDIPIADAGADQSMHVWSTVQLDGNESTDPEGSALTYSWSIVEKPVGSNPVLSDPGIVNPVFSTDVPGDYNVSLVVNDGSLDSVADTMMISVDGSNVALNRSVTMITPIVGAGDSSYITDGSFANMSYSYVNMGSFGYYGISFYIDLGSLYKIERIVFLPSQTTAYKIESSVDGIHWTTRTDVSGLDYWNNTVQNITVSPTYTARYIRYTGTNHEDAYAGVGEFEVFGTPITTVVKKTGQTKSYNANGVEVTDGSLKDDGYYQKGVTPSYTRDDTNDIVTDNLTGLMWQDDADAATVRKPWLTTANYNTCVNDTSSPACNDTSGDTAATYCSDLVLGGYTDWRVPTATELEGIVDYGKATPSIDTAYFNNVSSDLYWSSTSVKDFEYRAWIVYFYYGNVYYYGSKGYNVYVRCVRDGQ